jgi:hypothetical protein
LKKGVGVLFSGSQKPNALSLYAMRGMKKDGGGEMHSELLIGLKCRRSFSLLSIWSPS